MRKLKSNSVQVKSQIDWESLRKRMILNGYQTGHGGTTPAPTPDNWLLTGGVWNDSGEWQDDDVWQDS
jgi:hypothetical protein